jgi:hypothetical protein
MASSACFRSLALLIAGAVLRIRRVVVLPPFALVIDKKTEAISKNMMGSVPGFSSIRVCYFSMSEHKTILSFAG